MKVLAVLGSPRRGGNTETLLDEALRGASDHGGVCEKIVLRDLRITPCLEIYQCTKAGICAIKDDMQTLFPKIEQAERLILASPICRREKPTRLNWTGLSGSGLGQETGTGWLRNFARAD